MELYLKQCGSVCTRMHSHSWIIVSSMRRALHEHVPREKVAIGSHARSPSLMIVSRFTPLDFGGKKGHPLARPDQISEKMLYAYRHVHVRWKGAYLPTLMVACSSLV